MHRAGCRSVRRAEERQGSGATDQIADFTATGLDVQVFGGTQIFVDGEPCAPQQHMLYKGVLPEDLPNLAWVIGYTSLSWTPKADLLAGYLGRLLKHMDEKGLSTFVARDTQKDS